MIDIKILDTPLQAQSCIDFVSSGSAGGLTTFIGAVRNQTQGKKVLKLEFEAYKPMAIGEMKKIAEEAVTRWEVKRMAIHHRTGTLEVGEIAVVIAVSTAHRKASIAACEYAIDRLKETVPIWKKEFFEDGEVWVAAHP